MARLKVSISDEIVEKIIDQGEQKRRTSEISRGSAGSNFWSLVLEGAQKDILMEIGFAQEKISQLLRHRLIELDPNFWSLDDDTVDLLKTGSPEDIEQEIDRKQNWILEFKTKLSKANKMTRLMYSTQATFHTTVENFIRTLPVPDPHGSTDNINLLTEAIGDLLLRLEETTIKNVELEMKLAALDVQIQGLQLGMKEVAKRNDLDNVKPRLEAVELQNCMLNEFLNRIISDMQETSDGMKTLEAGEGPQVRKAIRDGLTLNFAALEACFPNLNAPRNALSKYLWVPHDSNVHRSFSTQQLMQQYEVRVSLTPDMVQGLRRLKKSVKSMKETHALMKRVKKKILWNDRRKMRNYGAIMRFTIPKYLEEETEDMTEEIRRNSLNRCPD